MKIMTAKRRNRPGAQYSFVSKMAAAAVLVMAVAPSAAQAHSNGLISFTWDSNNPTFARKTCSRARADMRRNLKAMAQRHCKDTHDSPNNALRNTSFRKGTCTKTKAAGQRTSAVITGARFTAQCR